MLNYLHKIMYKLKVVSIRILKGIGFTIFIASGLTALIVLSWNIIRISGFLIGVFIIVVICRYATKLVFLILILAIAVPLYALIAWYEWLPLILIIGGGILSIFSGIILKTIGR